MRILSPRLRASTSETRERLPRYVLQVASREAALVHDEEDRVDRVWELERPALLLVHLDDQRQQLELVRLRRPGSGSCVQERVQLGQGRGVFGIVVDEVSHRTS